MKSRSISLILFFLFSMSVSTMFANKTKTAVSAPETAEKGKEVTIVINVSHKGNSKSHHTDWVALTINGVEVKKWEFDKKSLPADENFTLEYKLIANEDLNIVVKGNCNLHGSTGENTFSVKTI